MPLPSGSLLPSSHLLPSGPSNTGTTFETHPPLGGVVVEHPRNGLVTELQRNGTIDETVTGGEVY